MRILFVDQQPRTERDREVRFFRAGHLRNVRPQPVDRTSTLISGKDINHPA